MDSRHTVDSFLPDSVSGDTYRFLLVSAGVWCTISLVKQRITEDSNQKVFHIIVAS